jgi:hypothetical protein
MIRLGLVSAILPELSLAEVLELCARERFACVELMCWPAGRGPRSSPSSSASVCPSAPC